MTNRHGKPSAALLNAKTSFFKENDAHVKRQRAIAEEYAKQPWRTNCKCCGEHALRTRPDFSKCGIGYNVCRTCGHLNGAHEDTAAFCETIYTADNGEEYGMNYKVENIESYNYRVSTIYAPKAEFLYTTLLGVGVDPAKLRYLDWGCGSGYFVRALRDVGLQRISGADVSASQVEYGRDMGVYPLSYCSMENAKSFLAGTHSNVVCMIGVLEHLEHPREALATLRDNKNIEYFYLSLPLFSLSVYLEMLSPDVFHRQLSGSHTHLYTEQSIHHFCEEFGFDILAEWWFGTDIVDLFRHVSVTLHSGKAKSLWRKSFLSVIDALQLELDKKHLSSEVHVVLRKQ